MRLAAIVIQKVGFDNEFIAIYVVFVSWSGYSLVSLYKGILI